MEYKGYQVVPTRSLPLLEIKMKGQGAVPAYLAGAYTSRGEASKAIDNYLTSLLKGKPNGKTKSTRTA
jgi:hypothetical protein